VAVFLGVVGAVANHKHVTDRESNEINCDLDLTALRLVEQRARPEITDPALAQSGGRVGDRQAGIDDVVDQQYRPSAKAGRDVADELHRTAALFGKTLARQPHELDLGTISRPVERAGEVGYKHPCTLENADHDEIGRQLAHDLGSERIDPGGDLRRAEQNAQPSLRCHCGVAMGGQ